MNFLAPLFALGALAVIGPILFHLIRRTTREKTPFSTLMFLEPSPPRIT
ncbi:MAG: BatA domain-containing protein, partial [Chthoniobacter sp.]